MTKYNSTLKELKSKGSANEVCSFFLARQADKVSPEHSKNGLVCHWDFATVPDQLSPLNVSSKRLLNLHIPEGACIQGITIAFPPGAEKRDVTGVLFRICATKTPANA